MEWRSSGVAGHVYTQIFLPAQALPQMLQLYNDILQVELHLRSYYFPGFPAAFTNLICGGLIHFLGGRLQPKNFGE